jgi:thiol-disulfide isomerase/thioredoxin
VLFAVSISQLLLAVVFTVAGVAKLVERAGTREAIEAFGLPSSIAPAASLALPIAELAIAAALVPAATGRWGALAAAALLAAFCLGIGRVLRAGAAVECNCFGGLTKTEVGRGTLVRNLALAAVAVFVASSGQTVSAFRWVSVAAPQDRVGIAFLVACLAGLSWFCWRLLQQNGMLLLRLEDGDPAGARRTAPEALPPLETGTVAPPFSGQDLQGDPISLTSLLAAGHPVALFFTNPGCGACEAALELIAEVQSERADKLTLAVISGGSIDRIKAKAAEFGLNRVVPQTDESLFDAYRVYGVPGVVGIDRTGAISRPAALGVDAVREVILGDAGKPPTEALGLVTG